MFFASFQDTAKARGLVADDDEDTLALLECIQLGRSIEHVSGVLNAIVARLPTDPWALLVLWNSPPCSDKEPVPLQQHQPLHLRSRFDCLLLNMDGSLPMHCQGECRLWHTLAAGCECHLPAHLLESIWVCFAAQVHKQSGASCYWCTSPLPISSSMRFSGSCLLHCTQTASTQTTFLNINSSREQLGEWRGCA
jgi:hypothetical protein